MSLGVRFGIGLAALALAACGSGKSDDGAVAPAAAAAAPQASDDVGIELPAGFTATIFAEGLDRPRHIAVRDNGDVLVALRSGSQQVAPQPSEGGVMALRDVDGDGRADQRARFGRSDVDTGVAIHDGYVYFSSAL